MLGVVKFGCFASRPANSRCILLSAGEASLERDHLLALEWDRAYFVRASVTATVGSKQTLNPKPSISTPAQAMPMLARNNLGQQQNLRNAAPHHGVGSELNAAITLTLNPKP